MADENQINRITEQTIGAAIEVHRALGPGLLESAYKACLLHELNLRGVHAEGEKILPVVYKGVTLECGYRIDVLVENLVIVELKAVEEVSPVHHAQLLSYLKLFERCSPSWPPSARYRLVNSSLMRRQREWCVRAGLDAPYVMVGVGPVRGWCVSAGLDAPYVTSRGDRWRGLERSGGTVARLDGALI